MNGYFAPPFAQRAEVLPEAAVQCPTTRAPCLRVNLSVADKPSTWSAGSCATVEGAQLYALNATVVPSPTVSYLTLWDDSAEDMPVASTLNAVDGLITSNLAIVPTQGGYADAFIQGKGDLILDMSGYFAW